MTRPPALVAWLVAAMATAVGVPALGESPPGVTVNAIEVRAAMSLTLREREELAGLLAVEVGKSLTLADVRRSLRNLQASGLVGEVEAWRLGEGEGARVVFAVGRRLRVSTVELVGELGLRRADLEAVVVQDEATPLSESRILRGVYALQDLLAEEGFVERDVRVRVEPDVAGVAASVVYHVEAGARTRVGRLLLEGSLGKLSAAGLIEKLRVRPGEPLRVSRLEEDRERLETAFLEAGYWLAEVKGPRRFGDTGSTEVDLVYEVEAGPPFEIVTLGADVEQLRRRGLLTPLEGRRYDEALLLQTVQNIRRDYQSRGHYRAVVEPRTEQSEDLFRLSIDIAPGPLSELESLELEGNQWASDEQLAARMSTAAGKAFFSGVSRLVDSRLDEDMANLRSFYALQGFRRATVGPARVSESGSRLAVVVPIVEGPQQRVVDVAIEGSDAATSAMELGPLALRPGGPFHPQLLAEAADELLARLEDAGYLFAQVNTRLDWNEPETLVTAAFEVFSGPRVTVDRIVLRGGRRTEARLIRRTLELAPGEPLSRRSLLEAQRRLYRLGIFSRAQVRMAPAPPFSPRRDVLVSVTEGSERRLTYGAGYDSEDGLRGLLGFSRVNIFGRGVAARFDLRLSAREQQARALVRQPMLSRWAIPVTYSVFGVEEDQKSFDSIRRGFQVEAEHRRKTLQTSLLYTFKIVEVENPDAALEDLEIDRELAEVEISSLTPSLFIDRRDDVLLPEQGWTLRLQTEYAFPLFAADAEFLKLFTQHTSYLPLGGLGTLASSLRLGAIEPVGSAGVEDTTLPPDLPSRFIPISERFFGGGRTSHRAYRRDNLGIAGATLLESEDPDDAQILRRVPVGGNGLFLFNLDYRFPIAGPLGGTAFFDIGNVWADWRDLEPGDLKKGAGLGLRYLSPIGPLRLEVGWKLDRDSGEDPAVVFLSFGNPF